MAILIYDYYELEERAGKHLRVWKAWHIIIFASAAIFGMLNYVFLHNTMHMVGDHCILRTPKIKFETVLVYTRNGEGRDLNRTIKNNETEVAGTSEAQSTTVAVPSHSTINKITKREANYSIDEFENITDTGYTEEREVLDLTNTYFGSSQDCEFAEYMPIMASMFALVWITMFVMCPGGGRPRAGLKQPWRILAPALLFSLVLVGLTGHSFTQTNRGLREFCSAFYNYTNATTCSSVNTYIERSWNASWKFGARAEATRAASAGLWVCWAGAAMLFIVRCLTAPDFQLTKTGVYIDKDPEQKLTPHLRASRRREASVSPSPNKSGRSEPTVTTELVTASVDSSSSRSASPAPVTERDSSV